MSELTVSKYINNCPASKKKHIYSRLLDYFSMFVVTYIFFTIFYYVGGTTPIVRRFNQEYTSSSRKIMDYINESRLLSYNEKKNDFIDANETAKDYLLNLTKTSAYIHNMQIPEYDGESYTMRDVDYDETFLYNQESYPLDNLSYYYHIFKKTDPTLNNYIIGGVDYSSDIETYQYKKAMVITDDPYHVDPTDTDYESRGEGLSIYLVLTSEYTEKMINRVIKNERIDENTNALYNKLFNAYRRGIDFGESDLENNSSEFARLNKIFKNSYQNLTKSSAIIYLISYFVAFVVLNGLVCLISKECVTIGQKAMRLGLSDTHENNLSWWRILVYQLVNFVLFFSSAIVSFYFIGIFGVLSYEIFPKFTLLAVLLFLLMSNILSLGMSLFTSKSHDLSTLAAGIMIKDKNEFETSPEDDLKNLTNNSDIINNEENSSGE